MNPSLTSRQYRELAEGLLRKAIDAPVEKKQDYIQHAAAYLAFARAQDEQGQTGDVTVNGNSSNPLGDVDEDEIEDRYRQVRQLIKQALEVPTPDGVAKFLDFTTSFRRLGVWNARMAYIQRPGARIIASEYEWNSKGRQVVPDAIPIIILWPSSPIRFVYELEDTAPRIDREAISDPFAVKGAFQPRVLSALGSSLIKQKSFKISIEGRRQGFNSAGSATSHGVGSIRRPNDERPLWNENPISDFALKHGESHRNSDNLGIPTYRVIVNDRLEPKERFVTIAHELGHIFLGHLGKCASQMGKDEESGWPDRRLLGKNEMEVEAEAVAYLIASRAGIVSASAQYMKAYATRADMTKIDIDLIVRSAARIERMSKIRYGSMAFKAPS
jgi:hypothetical protein